MTHLTLITSELKNAGFKVTQFSNAIEVTLKNRKPSQMEVSHVLEQAFDDIQFNLKSTSNSVIVKE